MKEVSIVALPGDGIGPEVTDVALQVLDTVCEQHDIKLNVTNRPFGGTCYDEFGEPVTDEILETCKEHKVVLLGAVGGPKWDDLSANLRPEAALLKLRKELGVYANLRPIFVHSALSGSSTLKEEVIEGTDILIVRELTGGVYFGKPRFSAEEDGDPFSVDTMKYSRSEVQRVARIAFEIAKLRGKRVCSVDKMNVLESSRLWRKSVLEVAEEYPDVELSHMLVDNAAMQLIRNPKQFDVIVTGNLFGDILSDEASMLTGSIGMLPSASLGGENGLYEPVHGSAPDIAGQGIANPLAAVASAALLCRHSLKLESAAKRIEAAILKLLDDGYRPADLYNDEPGTTLANTEEISNRLITSLEETAKA
ncbi:MAG: 3-isopropylmalate dehydrogenase [Balneolaceae bacterium]|nr:3-isopropylmalate dehydrogenase [Balneolaceae bacterium]MDR9408396.1 3-isopropylmalate dehydrogenase [Balneolaceae bacterium]